MRDVPSLCAVHNDVSKDFHRESLSSKTRAGHCAQHEDMNTENRLGNH